MNRNNEPVGLALRGDVVQVICRNTDLVGLIDCNRHDRNMFELKHVCDTANSKHCPRSSQLHVPAYALTKYGADKGPRSRIGVSVLLTSHLAVSSADQKATSWSYECKEERSALYRRVQYIRGLPLQTVSSWN